MSNITITDVAEHAGVSIKTVSRVLNREPNVSPDTRKRVEQSIASLRYAPNHYARGLAGSRAFVVGLLYDSPCSSYVIDIQRGALKVCQREHWDLLIHPCNFDSSDLAAEVGPLLRQSKVDGFLLTPPLSDHQPLLKVLRDTDAHFARVSPGDHADLERSVFTNDRQACVETTTYLVSLGHTSIAFIIGDPNHKALRERYRGYADGLKAAGLPGDPRLVKQGFNTFASGMQCGLELLNQDSRPTAIFASNDEMAVGVMHGAHQLGVRVPRDLSIVGFDDIPMAQHIFPALTTIRQPVEALAAKATELLIGQLRDEPAGKDLLVIESVIQVRESTAPPVTRSRPAS